MYFKEQRENKVFPGDIKAVVRPDPIPNSAVKRCVADGSACIACARVGRCRGFSLRSDEVSVTPSLLLFSPSPHSIHFFPFTVLLTLSFTSFLLLSHPSQQIRLISWVEKRRMKFGTENL